MFHVPEAPVTDPSSSAVSQKENSTWLTKAIWIGFGLASLIIILWLGGVFQNDPYIKASLHLEGSPENGESLFRVNCVGCHGISAQGLLGPDLHDVSYHLSEKKIINQIIQGKTPPMPSFQMEPQAMADLLTYLHSLT